MKYIYFMLALSHLHSYPMAQSRLELAQSTIEAYFQHHAVRVFTPNAVATILAEHRSAWHLAKGMTLRDFIAYFSDLGLLTRLDFPFPYRAESRYVWGQVPLLEVLLTLKPGAYFSHATAMRLHRLTERLPGTIYVNHEQRPQAKNPHLEQRNIDAAFQRRPRMSQNAVDLGNVRVCLVNGMHTNQLGVIGTRLAYDGSTPAQVRVTSVERTLIDIAVRPAYAGGVAEVSRAFALARERADAERIADLLHKLGYVYPYHQAIGYYLDRAGYPIAAVDLFRRQGLEFDFYLAHEMRDRRYIKEWRLYVPQEFA
ncbi:hypothetical protein E4K72_05645 [Oxalobacteraceae bacterium OM1]|nr:hypothetical protein E4K72_05645 [Oxalobacteraceae bacterium OM1]